MIMIMSMSEKIEAAGKTMREAAWSGSFKNCMDVLEHISFALDYVAQNTEMPNDAKRVLFKARLFTKKARYDALMQMAGDKRSWGVRDV